MLGRTISVIGAAALALSLGVAALPAAAQDAKIRIAFVSGPLYDSFFPPLFQGAHDAARHRGLLG
jgi:simple sugar transport system substrate-binding protein